MSAATDCGACSDTLCENAMRLYAVTELCGHEITTFPYRVELQETRDVDACSLACMRPRGSMPVFLCTATEQTKTPTIILASCTQTAPSQYLPRRQLQLNLPPDSILVGFVYADRDMRVNVGVFDAVRIAGRDDISRQPPLERHQQIAKMLMDGTGMVRHHWAGFAESCRSLLDVKQCRLPFDVDALSPVAYLPTECGHRYLLGAVP